MSSRACVVILVFVGLLVPISPARAGEEAPTADQVVAWLEGVIASLVEFGEHAVGGLLARLEKGEGREEWRTEAETVDGPLIQIDARLLQVTPALLTRLLGENAPDENVPARTLPASVAELLLQDRPDEVAVLAAPRLTTFDGQKANISILSQTSYVKDYEVRKAESGNTVVAPIVEVIQDGLVFDFLGTRDGAGETVGLELTATVADLKRPIAEFHTVLAGQEVTIQIPELTVSRVTGNLRLADGGWGIVGGFGRSAGADRVILVQVRLVGVTPR
jgi:hypothetical protein